MSVIGAWCWVYWSGIISAWVIARYDRGCIIGGSGYSAWTYVREAQCRMFCLMHGMTVRLSHTVMTATSVTLFVRGGSDMSEDRFDLDALAARLSARGVPSFVTMTGGGVATLYGGELLGSDSDDGVRHVVAIGPGTYGYGSHPSYGWWEELIIGPDDDGSGDYVVWEGPRDIDAVVEFIVAHMDEYRVAVVEFLSGGAS